MVCVGPVVCSCHVKYICVIFVLVCESVCVFHFVHVAHVLIAKSRLAWAHTGIHDALSAVNSHGLLGSVPILWAVACHVVPTLPSVCPVWATWAAVLGCLSPQSAPAQVPRAVTMATWSQWARLLVLDSAWAAAAAPRLALHARKQQLTRNMDQTMTLPPVMISGPSPVDAVAVLAALFPSHDADAAGLGIEPQEEVSVAALHAWLTAHGIASVPPLAHPLRL
jgi:hypothetical protein